MPPLISTGWILQGRRFTWTFVFVTDLTDHVFRSYLKYIALNHDNHIISDKFCINNAALSLHMLSIGAEYVELTPEMTRTLHASIQLVLPLDIGRSNELAKGKTIRHVFSRKC